jgi:hypothetical protein
MCYGILTGQTLAKVVIEDAIGAISVLNGLEFVWGQPYKAAHPVQV